MKGELVPLFIIVAIGAFCWQLWRVRRGVGSRNWRPVKATLVSAYVDDKDEGDGEITFSAHVEYTYKIRTETFASKRLTYSDRSGLSQDEACRLVAGMTAGSEVTAYYNPSNPSQSVLRKGFDEKSFIRLAVSFALIGGFVLWLLTTA